MVSQRAVKSLWKEKKKKERKGKPFKEKKKNRTHKPHVNRKKKERER